MNKFKIENLLEYGFYLFVFLLPWQTKLILRQTELGRGPWEYGTISLYGADILAAILLIIFSVHYFLNRKKKSADIISLDDSLDVSRTIDPSRGAPAFAKLRLAKRDYKKERGLIFILSGLDLFIFVSIFFASDVILAIYRYALVLLGIGLFWLIVKTKISRAKTAVAFLSGLFLPSILAIWQFLNQGAFAFKWLGLAAHSPADLGASVIETAGADGVPERWLRAYGSLDHPNIMGGFLAVGLLVLIWIIVNQKIVEGEKRDKKFIIFHLSLIILFAALIFTFSRSAALALLFGLLIFLFEIIRQKNWLALKKLGASALITAAIFGMVFFSYQNLFITRAQGAARLEVKSFSERKMYLEDSLKLIKKYWLFGAGAGNYTKALAESRPKQPWYYLQPVHNLFLLLWVETGIGGLLFFIAFLLYLGVRSWRKKSVLSLSILSALVIMMIFDHYLWSLHFGVLFFWLTAGFISKENS